MAGGIVGVEPLELPGAYRAKMADGSSMMVHGPAGEQLAKRFAPSESASGPNALASNDAVGNVGKGLLYTNPLTAPLAATYDLGKKAYDAVYAPAAPKERVGTTVTAADQPAAQPETTQASAAPAPAQAAAPAQAGPLGYSMKGVDPATGKEIQGMAVRREDGSIGIYVPPVAGSKGGMTKLGQAAVKNTADAEAEAARQNALSEISRQRGVDAALDESAEREGYLIEQQKQNLMAAQQQQDEIDKQTAAVDKLNAGYMTARDDFMNSKVDPDQYMKGDTARGIFSALGVMLNQFGSAFTHQPNVAAEFVNSQIDRNIRAQETQINVKGKAADNMLADLTRQTGDLKLAKVAMKQLLTERATIEAQRVGMGAKNQAVKAGASEVAAKLSAQAALQDNARKQGFVEHVMSNPLYYQRGSAGRSGGFITPTQESYQSGAENARQNEELRIKQEKEAAGGGTKDKVGFRGVAAIAAARVAAGAVDEMANAMGMKRGADGKYEPPSWGSVLKSHIPKTDIRQKLKALDETLPSEVNKAQTGGTATVEGMKAMHDQIDGLKTPGDYAAFVNHYAHTMKEVEGAQREVAGSVHAVGDDAQADAEGR